MGNNNKKKINEGSEYAISNLMTIYNSLPTYATFAEVTDFGGLCNRLNKAGEGIIELVRWIEENSK